MVNHETARLWPSDAMAISGHVPMIFHNVTTSTMCIYCDTCGWNGGARKGRWRSKVEEDWRVHAGDLAMGFEGHGDNCHCWHCYRARQDASVAGVVAAAASRSTQPTEEPG